MAEITVIRGENGNQYSYQLKGAQSDDQYTLAVLRQELTAAELMADGDSFLKGKAIITGDETQRYLAEILPAKEGDKPVTRVVTIAIGASNEKTITIVRPDGKSTIV